MNDPVFLRASFRQSFWEDEPGLVFSMMRDRLDQVLCSPSPDAASDLIQIASCFAELRNERGFADRCRDICSAGMAADELTFMARAWFSDFAPHRTGVPVAEDQNAQMLISLPRGVQRARARQNRRSDHEALLRTPFPDVVEILCGNPALRECDVLFMASRRPTQNALLEPLIASAWFRRPAVRCALAANPYLLTSHSLRTAFTLSAPQRALLADMQELHPQLRIFCRQINTRCSNTPSL